MAESKNKKKLTKSELHEENEKIREDIRSRDETSHEDTQRIVNSLRWRNIGAYTLVLIVPIIGIFVIWWKREDLKLNRESLLLWTAIGIIILIEQIKMILKAFHVMS